jgi:hypothetical protein
MLGVRTYAREYVDTCRAKVESDLATYRQLTKATLSQAAPDGSPISSAVGVLETSFFNNMVLVLDYLFVHRLRTVEGKDGNALNEVRVLCDSMLQHGNVLTADNAVKLSPAKSVLKYQFGQPITVNEADFQRIFQAFFAEIERKFV